MSRRGRWLGWSALVLVTAAAAANASRGSSGDITLYRLFGEAAVAGSVAGWHVPSPYPPGATLTMLPMALAEPANESVVWVAAVTLPFTLAMFVMLARSRPVTITRLAVPPAGAELADVPPGSADGDGRLRAAAVVAIGSLLLYDWWLRYEPAVAAAVLAGLLAARANHPARAGGWLSIGFWLKGWPLALLVPVALRARWTAAAAAAAGVGAVAAAATASGGSAVWSWVTFNADRPPQPEALATLWALLLRSQGAQDWSIRFDLGYYAYVVEGPAVSGAADAVTLGCVLWAGLAVGGYLMAPRPVGSAWSLREVRVMLCLTTAVILASPVFSPQYLAWLIPIVAVAALDRHLVPETVAVLVACGLTTYVHPHSYDRLVGGEAGPVLVLLVRDLILLVVMVRAGLPLLQAARDGRPRRSRHPAGAGYR